MTTENNRVQYSTINIKQSYVSIDTNFNIKEMYI